MYLKKHLGFHKKLFFFVIIIFIFFISGIIIYQYHREKVYKEDVINNQLEKNNDGIYEQLKHFNNFDSLKIIDHYRVTLIDLDGNVLFDTKGTKETKLSNHINRPEIQQALKNGVGFDVRRVSQTTKETYFYSAKRFENVIIRTAAPYDNSLKERLKSDSNFLWIVILFTFIFGIIFYILTHRLGKNIKQLNDFAMQADRDEILDNSITFLNNELGEISQHIVQIFKRMMNTKKALEKERDLVIKNQEEQTRIKRQLTQNIAHELKTPVSSIQGFLETIINNQDLSEEQKDDFIERCYKQSSRLSALLHDISNLTRLEDAAEMIDVEKINVSEIVATVLKEVSLNLNEKHIRVNNNLLNKNIEIVGNQSLLYSIFRNLMDNSISYAGENIDITIDCFTEDDKFFYFSFSDNGIGIADEHLPRVFERFYRIDKGRSRKLGGTGLGLAIVKNSILFHGGTITAKKLYNGGLEFVFSLKKSH